MSGASGSGKTFTSMSLLRKLFEVASPGLGAASVAASGSSVGGSGAMGSGGGGGGHYETDTFKHLAASFTVLRSLCSAKTATNRESSRVGHFIEVQVRHLTIPKVLY